MRKLDEKALKAAYVAGYDAKGSRRQQVEAAIRAYLDAAPAPTVSTKEHRVWTGSKWSEWLPGETPAVIKELFPTWEDRPATTVSAEPVGRGDGWRGDCPQCVASKFTCDAHIHPAPTVSGEPVAWLRVYTRPATMSATMAEAAAKIVDLRVNLASADDIITDLRSRLAEAERERDRYAATTRAKVLEEALKQIGEILSAVSMPNRDAIVARLQVIAIIERALGEKP